MVKQDNFLKENSIVQLGYLPVRIDILNTIDGVQFSKALAHRLEQRVEGVKGKDDFIKNKKAVGRSPDLSDIKEIEK